MSAVLAIVFALVTYIIIRFLHLTAPSSAPVLLFKDQSSQFVESVLNLCPILQKPYVPTALWGKSGHVQTVVYAKMGRVVIPVPNGVRHSKVMQDGATMTFDLYEPFVAHKSGEKYCFLICPGIGSSSESAYIRTLVDGAQKNGYISAVLNYLGALKDVPLTSPRMFTYGGTEELAVMREEIQRLFPGCGLILVGCSMGGNVLLKYLGEQPDRQNGILAAVSVCTGYSIEKAMPMMYSWTNLRKGYGYVITANQKIILKQHKNQLLTPEVKKELNIDEDKLFSIPLMPELDNMYHRKRGGFETIEEYYRHHSASYHLHKVKIPLLLVNAEDDPLVPPELLEFPREAARTLPFCIFALTKHGGHLGYFEHGFFKPSSVTWMDRLFIEFANAVATMHQEKTLPIPRTEDLVTLSKTSQLKDEAYAPKSASAGDVEINGQARLCNDRILLGSGDEQHHRGDAL